MSISSLERGGTKMATSRATEIAAISVLWLTRRGAPRSAADLGGTVQSPQMPGVAMGSPIPLLNPSTPSARSARPLRPLRCSGAASRPEA
jgi:hypothetical protein